MMATQIEPKELDLQEQMASIRRHMAEIDQRQKEQKRIDAEINQRDIQTKFEPRKFWLSAVVAAGGLIGVTITLTKLFL